MFSPKQQVIQLRYKFFIMHTKFRAFLILILSVNLITGYKILAIFPNQINSHFSTFDSLLTRLHQHGHEITLISHFVPSANGPNLTHINLIGSVKLLREIVPLNRTSTKFYSRLDKYLATSLISGFADEACHHGLASESFQKFLNRVKSQPKDNYDLVLAEFFNTDCFLGLMKWLHAPLIALSSCYALPWTNAHLGNPDNPAYAPVVFLDHGTRMGFLQRVENTLVQVASRWLYQFMSVRSANVYARRFIDDGIDDVEAWARNASILLVNTHFTINGALPKVPGVIEVGGIHIGNVKMLPVVSIILVVQC